MILLNPGPVNVSPRVTAALARGDLCHREPEYGDLQASIRSRLVRAFAPPGGFTAVLITGSGTAALEAAVTSVLSARGRLVVVSNGVYGERIAAMAAAARLPHTVVEGAWAEPPDLAAVERALGAADVEAVAVVHHETTTGLLNPVSEVGRLAHMRGKLVLVDSVSGLAGDALHLAHVALAARRSDVRRAPRRAQGAWLRHLRGPGPARARALPGRQHGAARARGLRALPRGARRGAGRVTAILLAAGVGKRLLGFSNGRPKCLIEIGGKSLLVRLLEGLAAAGVREAVVVVGFGEDAVRAAVGGGPRGIHVRCLSNPRFREGAILSLWTARELLDGPVLVMDADVLCPPAMIARLVGSPSRNCFLLDASVEVSGEEQMLLVRGERVLAIVRGGAPGYA